MTGNNCGMGQVLRSKLVTCRPTKKPVMDVPFTIHKEITPEKMNEWKFCNEIKLHKIETAWYLWQEVTYISLKDLFKSGPNS